MTNRVLEYIEKQPLVKKEICLSLRELIFKTFPDVKEEMKWGVPVFFEGLFYIGPVKDHVNLGFAISGLSIEEIALFEGNGKTMRHIKIANVNDIDEAHLVKLLKLVYIKAKCEGC
ncbi:DUF1801 domain-containing protein [Candidatus Margulisiibacteriota bacterium]